MRSFLVLISAVIIAVMGFGIYWMMTGAEAPPADRRPNRTGELVKATLPTTSESVVGPGQGAGWDKYDPKTGLLTSRIRVDQYVQAKDGTLRVTRPRVDFFMKNGQVLRIYGERGTIQMQETVSRSKSGMSGPNLGQPRSGDLSDVTLYVLPDADTADEKATLTIRMNNASFDNETFKIQTEAYHDEAGNLVQGDRVPIVVRGTDYEFDGTGLRLQYNEVEQRLEYLRVAYGQRMLVKNTRALRKPANPEPKPGATNSGAVGQTFPSVTDGSGAVGQTFLSVTDGRAGDILVPPSPSVSPAGQPFPSVTDGYTLSEPLEGILLAAAKPVPVGPVTRRAVPSRLPATRPKRVVEQPIYRATFKENVEVYQAAQKLATGEELVVDFLPEEQDDDAAAVGIDPSNAATRPSAATRPVTTPDQPRRRPTTRPSILTTSATRPTMRQAEEPIEIHWTGPLVVVPLAGDKPARIAPGEAIVRISGSPNRPVEVGRKNGDVTTTLRCAKLTHWTIDQGAQLEETKDLPVQMSDSRGMKLLTHTMVYSQADGNAILYGKSTAKLPVTPPDARGEIKSELMDAAWTERCILNMRGGDLDAMQIDRVSLQGAVTIRHPQISLDSNMLDLQFANEPAAPATQPTTRPATTTALKQLDANGNVKCVAIGQGGEKDVRKIDCDSLKLLTAPGKEGKLYVREMVAIGNVYTSDPDREMWAGNLNVVLAQPTTRPATTRPATQFAATQPATRPSTKDSLTPGELESLWAHLDVRIRTADGKEAHADQLNIEVKDKQTQVTLHGRPATVKREKDSLSGPVITMAVESQHLTIMGEGKLTGVQQQTPDKPGRPVEVTWKRMLDGQGDIVDVEGDVVAKSFDADGTVNTATGQRVRMATTRPTTRPTTQPAIAKKPTTRPTGELDVMANRVIQAITLSGSAVCNSVLNDKLGTLLRRFHVASEVIQFMQKEEKAKELVIPGPGRMLFEDFRPVANDADAKERAMDPMGMHGTTAFGWKERLTYSEKASQLVMTGDVIVAREPTQGEKHEPMVIQGDRIVADIVPQDQLPPPGPAAKPGAAAAMNIGGMETKVQLKMVHVEGNVTARNEQLYVVANEIDYDPAAHLLTVRGKGRQRARQLDPKNELETASFDEMVWNTQTNQVIRATNLQATRRQ